MRRATIHQRARAAVYAAQQPRRRRRGRCRAARGSPVQASRRARASDRRGAPWSRAARARRRSWHRPTCSGARAPSAAPHPSRPSTAARWAWRQATRRAPPAARRRLRTATRTRRRSDRSTRRADCRCSARVRGRSAGLGGWVGDEGKREGSARGDQDEQGLASKRKTTRPTRLLARERCAGLSTPRWARPIDPARSPSLQGRQVSHTAPPTFSRPQVLILFLVNRMADNVQPASSPVKDAPDFPPRAGLVLSIPPGAHRSKAGRSRTPPHPLSQDLRF